MSSFGDYERRMLAYFKKGSTISFKGKNYQVLEADKPTCAHGEPKTDIYVLVTDGKEEEEIKISYKKENADFLENKTSAERAEQIFGPTWRTVIENSTLKIKDCFKERPLIYKSSFKKTEKGAITLGWKFELLNKPSGDLSGRMELSDQQIYDVYSGANLFKEKKDAVVNGRIIKNSGVADYILISNHVNSAQDIIDQMEPIQDYIADHPYIYFACKALNYRTLKNKYDGNRPLAVQVNWQVKHGKLSSELIFNEPLEMNGTEMAKRLLSCLNDLSVQTTDDIDENNADMENVHK